MNAGVDKSHRGELRPEPFFVDNNVVSKLLYPALTAVFWQNKMSPEQAMAQVLTQINAELAQVAAKRKEAA